MVKLTEPMTMLTDYVLGIYIIVLSILAIQQQSVISSAFIYFAVGFIATALSALLGGTAHGFVTYLSKKQHKLIWLGIYYSIGIAGFGISIGAIYSVISNATLTYVLVGLSFLLLAFYVFWMLSHNEFKYAIYYYVPALVIALVLESISLPTNASAPWIIAGILVTFLASGIQISKIGIHKHFNHNDLFHVIQIIASYILYRGILLV